jgi:hypothetical protein
MTPQHQKEIKRHFIAPPFSNEHFNSKRVQHAEASPVVVYDFQAGILSSSLFHKAVFTSRVSYLR